MHIDSYFEKGHSHEICEDYVIHGNIYDLYYMIVSDGCSSSKDTDVGSRLLAHICKGVLEQFYDSDMQKRMFAEKDFSMFEFLITNRIQTIMSLMSLEESVFDATLMICFLYNNVYHILTWGDGVVVVDTDVGQNVEVIEFESGAPFYLSYLINNDRHKAYDEQFPGKKNTKYYAVINGDYKNSCDGFETNHDIKKPYYACYNVEDINGISLMSDGVLTYHYSDKVCGTENHPTPEQKTSLIFPNILSEILGYKNQNGEFVKRRMKRMKTDFDKKQIEHFDDISVATMRFLL